MQSHDREIIDAHMRIVFIYVYTGEWNSLVWYQISIHINALSHMLKAIYDISPVEKVWLFVGAKWIFGDFHRFPKFDCKLGRSEHKGGSPGSGWMGSIITDTLDILGIILGGIVQSHFFLEQG